MKCRENLPKSLDALRVFETAARLMNFSAAARELLVTQAAVSRRIQALEAALGFELFERRGRRLALTARGEALAARVGAALDYLDESVGELSAPPAEAAVTISASTSVSHLWLGPALRAYALEGETGGVRVLTADGEAEAAHESNDIAILYGAGAHPRWNLAPLLPELLAPVASPAHLAAHGIAPEELPLPIDRLGALDLLDYDRVRPQWMTLARWFGRMAPTVPMQAPRRVFTTYIMAVEAALAGEGAILGSLALLRPQLASGALLRLTEEIDVTGFAYCIGLKRDAAPRPAALRLHGFLSRRAAAEEASDSLSAGGSDAAHVAGTRGERA